MKKPETVFRECKKHGYTEHRLRGKKKPWYRCSKCEVENVSNWRRNTKLKAVSYKGGKCEHCGLVSSYPQVYEFHHLDPKQKDFGIGKGGTLSWSKIQKELDKCIILCANCHRIEHAKKDELL